MSRKGVLILFFDLPMVNGADRKRYRDFMKCIKHMGYMMLQESVYIKVVRNIERIDNDERYLRNEIGENGNVYLLPIRVNTFSHIITISGNFINTDALISDIIAI